MQFSKGLTLPELIIIVFIVSFLALLVAPNHTDCGPRSKVVFARGDMRAIATSLESYFLEHHAYPAWSVDPGENTFGERARSHESMKNVPTFVQRMGIDSLTTPVAYLTSYLPDPLSPLKGATYAYWVARYPEQAEDAGWILWSAGPDRDYDLNIDNIAIMYDPRIETPTYPLMLLTYDPTNGSTSNGDVYREKQ